MKATIRIGTLVAVTLAAPAAFAADGAVPLWQPTTITQPGAYVVTRDIASDTGPIFDIQVGRVSVDLKGHTLTVSGVAQPAIKLSSLSGIDPEPFRIANGTILGGLHGIQAVAGIEPEPFKIRLAQLTLGGQAESGVRIEAGGSLEATGIIVVDTRVGFDLVGASSGAGTPSPERPTARITGSLIQADVGVRCSGMRCQVTDSSITSCGIAARLTNAAGSLFSGNTTVSPGASVCFNPQPEPPGPDILIESSPGTVVSSNTLVGAMASSGSNHGIVADASSHGVNIAGNAVRGFGDDGIRALGNDVTVHGNVVTGNGGRGIHLGGQNDLAEGNKVGGNGGTGLYFATSDHVFRDNVLRNNAMATGGPGLADSIDGGGNIN